MDKFIKDVGDILDPKEEDGDAIHPYEQLEKAKVLQDARIFHDSILVRENPRKCCRILAQILYLQNDPKSKSTKLTRTEATELFFAGTKLFVDVQDSSLRRLVYLFIKEIQPLCDPSDVIIVTSCLTKDMTCDDGLYRANAIRVLVNIIDSAMLGSIERYIKQAIVDNDLHVSNAALVSASHLFEQSTDNATIVRRWVGEVQEMLIKQSSASTTTKDVYNKSNAMVQANAMRLLCLMKSHDRLGMAKLVQKFSTQAGSGIQSPLAIVILIRLCGKLLLEELAKGHHNNTGDVRDVSSLSKLCFDFLESSLAHSDEMIYYEAARTICVIPNLGTHNLSPAIESFRRLLLSDKPAARFAAVRTLSKVTNRRAVAMCGEELETCIEDENRQIATLAVTTLLRTGSEASIDKILGNIATLLESVEDEYKISMLRSLEEICITYPSKHRYILSYLSNLLREEGGFDFKRSIIDSIVSLMKKVPETTGISLLHLCEFIEDCEYIMLASHAIHIIAELGPMTSTPSQYIRFIYNRVILDNSTVRAAAVAALCKFAAQCPSLRTSIITLLKRCLNDEDDETRDRATVAVSVLNEAMVLNPYMAPDVDDYDDIVTDSPTEGDLAALVYLQQLPMSFKNLESSIKTYISTPGALESAEQLTFSLLPIIEDLNEDAALGTGHITSNGFDSKPAIVEVHDAASAIYAIPELAEFGRVYRSTTATPLTEEETEYVVRCIKHIMPEHVILQFSINNTVEDQRLENCTVAIDMDNSDIYQIIGDVPAEKVDYGETVSTFTVLQRNITQSIEPVCFTCQLNFMAVQVDPESGEPLGDGYAEEYPLEDLMISPSSYMARVAVSDFRQAWNGTNDVNEALGRFAIQPKTVHHALAAVIELLGMAPCDGTGQVRHDSLDMHMLHLSGKFLGGHEVLARAQLTLRPGEGTLLKIAVRSNDKAISDAIMSCLN
ncbi:hypothetical protein ACHAXR_007807 [Thalassiosira sp. AJA248-18]